TNPVSKGVFDTFPDPSIIKGKDGFWYAYGTTDPVRQSFGDNSFHFLPMAKSKDMVHWDYVGDVFSQSTFPKWLPGTPGVDSFLWAPDIRYLNGKYYLYYSGAHFGSDGLFSIGVATAPTPTGPWTDSGSQVIEGENCPPTTNIDPAEFTDKDGTHYLYWGSYGAICAAKLTPDGTRLASGATQITYGGQAEAAYVVRRAGYYYLFISEGGCCSGPLSSYEVFVGRSTNPLGPFYDREGVSMMASRRGGTLVLAANGNKWVGPGHHSIATDLSGQQWFVYHAIDKNNPYLAAPHADISRRPLMIDRLDWIDGWPTVRAGAWASEDSQATPVTSFIVGDDFNNDTTLGTDWLRQGSAQDGWQLASEQDAGTYVHQSAPSSKPAYLVSAQQAPADFRAEADLRLPAGSAGAAGLLAAYRDPANHIEAWLDAGANALVTDAIVNSRHSIQKTALPAGFRFDTWHNVAIEVHGTDMTTEVTEARLGEPLASQTRTLPSGAGGQGAVGVASRSARSDGDNVGATSLYAPVTQTVPDPTVGTLYRSYSDEFNGNNLDRAWSWVRTPAGQESGGAFVWPTQSADLYGSQNDASVLLRDAPQGDYTVETKLTIDLGVNTDRSYQQAGLVAYADDDHYTKLVHVAVGTGRRTEFAKEYKEQDGGYGGMMVGPPSDTTWLRISHRVDPNNGEDEYRAATSRDGAHWIWGGVWTFPADKPLTRIGLVSMGGPGATAQFDYFRVYRP
ncbi:MAG: family 43 glycosylhydrolase, partial [Actinomycetota bacterium]|nr:family 43 glycosylhydrolase [Actinomycetota bacterium]